MVTSGLNPETIDKYRQVSKKAARLGLAGIVMKRSTITNSARPQTSNTHDLVTSRSLLWLHLHSWHYLFASNCCTSYQEF